MQVSNTLLIVAAEIFIALLAAALVLFFYARKLKSLTTRQQAKLLELLQERKNTVQPQPTATISAPEPVVVAPPPTIPSVQNYKDYRHKMITATTTKYSLVAVEGNIDALQDEKAPLLQRILALRHAFLQAEELGEAEIAGTDKYWSVFEQTLAPLLSSAPNANANANKQLEQELDDCKKRIDSLENARYSWLDLQQQSANLHSKTREYQQLLLSLISEPGNLEEVSRTLQQYQEICDDIFTRIANTVASSNEANDIDALFEELKTANEDSNPDVIDIDDQQILSSMQDSWIDEDAAQEQQPALNTLSEPEDEPAIHDKLLEDELAYSHDAFIIEDDNYENPTGMPTESDIALTNEDLGEENLLEDMPLTLDHDLDGFELSAFEDNSVKLDEGDQKTDSLSTPPPSDEAMELQKIQTAYSDLQKQYSELQEKYLDMKTTE